MAEPGIVTVGHCSLGQISGLFHERAPPHTQLPLRLIDDAPPPLGIARLMRERCGVLPSLPADAENQPALRFTEGPWVPVDRPFSREGGAL